MLENDPGAERSGVRPFVVLVRSQKYRNVRCSSVSRKPTACAESGGGGPVGWLEAHAARRAAASAAALWVMLGGYRGPLPRATGAGAPMARSGRKSEAVFRADLQPARIGDQAAELDAERVRHIDDPVGHDMAALVVPGLLRVKATVGAAEVVVEPLSLALGVRIREPGAPPEPFARAAIGSVDPHCERVVPHLTVRRSEQDIAEPGNRVMGVAASIAAGEIDVGPVEGEHIIGSLARVSGLDRPAAEQPAHTQAEVVGLRGTKIVRQQLDLAGDLRPPK